MKPRNGSAFALSASGTKLSRRESETGRTRGGQFQAPTLETRGAGFRPPSPSPRSSGKGRTTLVSLQHLPLRTPTDLDLSLYTLSLNSSHPNLSQPLPPQAILSAFTRLHRSARFCPLPLVREQKNTTPPSLPAAGTLFRAGSSRTPVPPHSATSTPRSTSTCSSPTDLPARKATSGLSPPQKSSPS